MSNAASLLDQIKKLHATFVGEVAHNVAEYATTLGRRIAPETNTSPWEYGYPTQQEDGSYKITTWHERTGAAIRLTITFNSISTFLVKATCVTAEMSGDCLIVAKTTDIDTSSSIVALDIGAAFERHTTGRVCYSADECY